MLLASRHNGFADFLPLFVRPPNLQAWSTSHAMAKCAHFASGDIDHIHVEKLDLRKRPPVQLLQNLRRIRPLNLISIAAANYCFSSGVRRRAVVFLYLDVVSAGFAMKLDPVCDRGSADEYEPVLFEMEKDAIADYKTVVAAGRKLLCSIYRKLGEAVGPEIRKHLERVWPSHAHIRHMVRLVEEYGGLAPCPLLVAPVRIFVRNYRIDVRSDLRIAQQGYWISRALQQIL